MAVAGTVTVDSYYDDGDGDDKEDGDGGGGGVGGGSGGGDDDGDEDRLARNDRVDGRRRRPPALSFFLM